MSQNYAETMYRKLDSEFPGVSNRLPLLNEFPESVRQGVVTLLLGYACKSQHIGNITAGRHAVAKIPRSCVSQVLDASVRVGIDLADEWEYRRLLELLREIESDRFAEFVAVGLASGDAAIREAAEDFDVR